MGVAGLWDGLVDTPTKKMDGRKKAKAPLVTLTGVSTGSVKRQAHTNCLTMRFGKPLDSQIPQKVAHPKRRASFRTCPTKVMSIPTTPTTTGNISS
jgi:hypothetical protein